jgi:hypothetical protein
MSQENRDFEQGLWERIRFFIFLIKKEDCFPNLKDLTLFIVPGSPVFLLIKLDGETQFVY